MLAEKEKKLRAEAEALLLGKLGPIGKGGSVVPQIAHEKL